ncbi:DUF2283 domain-containing protein [Rhodopila sp.]|uniref:DUF2283 domain-containing protein n=1 Tax=Rhodopila sp. TaxID=2480087 RepID=UPI003D0BEE8D
MTNEPKGDRALEGGRVSYDSEADAIGVYFVPDGAEYDSSREVAPGVVLDYDKQGRVIGIELLHVRRLLAQGSSTVTANG